MFDNDSQARDALLNPWRIRDRWAYSKIIAGLMCESKVKSIVKPYRKDDLDWFMRAQFRELGWLSPQDCIDQRKFHSLIEFLELLKTEADYNKENTDENSRLPEQKKSPVVLQHPGP